MTAPVRVRPGTPPAPVPGASRRPTRRGSVRPLDPASVARTAAATRRATIARAGTVPNARLDPGLTAAMRPDPARTETRRSTLTALIRPAGTWWLAGTALAALLLISGARIAGGGAVLDWLVGALVALAAVAVGFEWRVVRRQDTGRRAEAESFARILRGLSRSVSPDAIVSAIVEELGEGTGADHIVVARRQPGGRLLEATLVATRPGVPSSQTLLPVTDLEDPLEERARARHAIATARGRRMVATPVTPDTRADPVGHAARPQASATTAGAPERIAGRIAQRVRDVYGLKHTIAAPLRIDGRVEGAIVISKRTTGTWPERAQRLLGAAAIEASAALARAYSHRAAEVRASTDGLTGLPNRRYFDEYVQLLARRRRADDRVGLLMVDIDHFKAVNDTFGHAVGDHVLRAVATAIGKAVREDDVPARFGGEEFAVLLRNPSPAVAVEVAERVRRAVGALDLRGLGIPGVSVSVGVAVAEQPDEPISALIDHADAALYRAKRAGRDRVIAA